MTSGDRRRNCLRGINARQVFVDELADIQTTVFDLTETTRTVNGEEDRQEEASRYAESACAGL